MYAPGKITPNSSVALSEIVSSAYFTSSEITISTPIIGVGTEASVNWATGATSVDSSTKVGEITIPSSATAFNTYEVYKSTYISTLGTGTYVNKLYTLSEYFYFIKLPNSTTPFVVPNYLIGTESTFFSVDSSIVNSGNVEFNLTNTVLVWSMETVDGKVCLINSTHESATTPTYGTPTYTNPTDITPTYNNSKILVPFVDILKYKLTNPTKAFTDAIGVQVKVNSVDVYFKIKYSLPSEINVEYTMGTNNNIVLIPSTTDTKFTGDYIGQTSLGGGNFNVVLIGMIIEEYFIDNPNRDVLETSLKYTGSNVEIKINIKKVTAS